METRSSKAVLKQAIDPTAKLSLQPKRAIDPTAKLSLQPKRAIDPTAKLSLQPKRAIDPTAKLSLQPKRAIDPTAELSRQPNVERPGVRGNTLNPGTGSLNPRQQELELQEHSESTAKENPKIVVTSGVAPVDPKGMKESGASGPRAVPPGGRDIDAVESSQVADKRTDKGKQVADKGEGASEGEEKTKYINEEKWRKVIDTILQLMYLAKDRNAAIVDVGVEEEYWHAEKRNVVAVAIGDDGVGMASKEKEFFDSKEFYDIPADYLILLTKTEKEESVLLYHKHNLECSSYLFHGSDGATSDARRLNLQTALGKIEKISPFRSFIEKEFDKIERTGTRMVVFGYGDFVFEQGNVREEDGITRNLVQTSSRSGVRQVSDVPDLDKRTFIKTLRSRARTSFLRSEAMIQVQGMDLNDNMSKIMGQGQIQEARDVFDDQPDGTVSPILDLTQEAGNVSDDQPNRMVPPILDSTQETGGVSDDQTPHVASLLLGLKVPGYTNLMTFKRCSNKECREWREMASGTEIDLLALGWTCSMWPFNGHCRLQAEDVVDDGHESEPEEEDFEPQDEDFEPEEGDFEPADEEFESDSELEDENLEPEDEESESDSELEDEYESQDEDSESDEDD